MLQMMLTKGYCGCVRLEGYESNNKSFFEIASEEDVRMIISSLQASLASKEFQKIDSKAFDSLIDCGKSDKSRDYADLVELMNILHPNIITI